MLPIETFYTFAFRIEFGIQKYAFALSGKALKKIFKNNTYLLLLLYKHPSMNSCMDGFLNENVFFLLMNIASSNTYLDK